MSVRICSTTIYLVSETRDILITNPISSKKRPVPDYEPPSSQKNVEPSKESPPVEIIEWLNKFKVSLCSYFPVYEIFMNN